MHYFTIFAWQKNPSHSVITRLQNERLVQSTRYDYVYPECALFMEHMSVLCEAPLVI